MPSSCCVPDCYQRGDLTPAGTKVNYFNFPKALLQRKQWFHAIRRDEGKHFRVTDKTKVCSLHFRSEDLRKSLNRRIFLRDGAVPSKFAWTVPSPTKRKPLRHRETPLSCSRSLDFSLESATLVTSANETQQQQ